MSHLLGDRIGVVWNSGGDFGRVTRRDGLLDTGHIDDLSRLVDRSPRRDGTGALVGIRLLDERNFPSIGPPHNLPSRPPLRRQSVGHCLSNRRQPLPDTQSIADLLRSPNEG